MTPRTVSASTLLAQPPLLARCSSSHTTLPPDMRHTAPYTRYRENCVDKLGVSIPGNSLYVSDLPYPYTRGVITTKPLPPGSTLLLVPSPALITASCAVDMPHLRSFFERLNLSPLLEDDTLALTLLYEKHATKDKSRWATYLSALPTSYDLPFMWSEEELAGLGGTGLHPIALRMRVQVGEDYATLVKALEALPKSKDDAGFAAFREAFTLPAYMWAICTVWSRGVSLRMGSGPNAPHVKTLAPFFDMFNTSESSRVRHFYDPRRRALVVESEQGWATGEQVCLNYGHRSTRSLIQLHGFVLPGSRAERYQLEMRFRGGGGKGTPAYDQKLALHRIAPPRDEGATPREEQGMLVEVGGAAGEAGSALFANFQLWEGVWPNALFRFLRIQLADPATVGELGDTLRKDVNGQCNVELEAEVLRLLSTSLVALLKALKSGGQGGDEEEEEEEGGERGGASTTSSTPVNPAVTFDHAKDAEALRALNTDTETGKGRLLEFMNEVRAEIGDGNLKPFTEEYFKGGVEVDLAEEGLGEEDEGFASLTAGLEKGKKGKGGGKKGGSAVGSAKGGATTTTTSSSSAVAAAAAEGEEGAVKAPSVPSKVYPPLSSAVTDATSRRLQMASYLRFCERRILESHVLMTEQSMDELRKVVEEYYKEEGGEKIEEATTNPPAEGGGGGGGGGGGASQLQ